MLDPLDKPPNLIKTVVRVCENIHGFIREASPLIHLACANSLVDVLDNCFPSKEDKLSLSLIFYEPMAVVINGGLDILGQMGAATCLMKLLNTLYEANRTTCLTSLCQSSSSFSTSLDVTTKSLFSVCPSSLSTHP